MVVPDSWDMPSIFPESCPGFKYPYLFSGKSISTPIRTKYDDFGHNSNSQRRCLFFKWAAKKPRGVRGDLFPVIQWSNISKHSNAKVLVLSGGGREQNNESEAEVIKNLAMLLVVPEDKIITELLSRNTKDQAIELAKIFPPTKNIELVS